MYLGCTAHMSLQETAFVHLSMGLSPTFIVRHRQHLAQMIVIRSRLNSM